VSFKVSVAGDPLNRVVTASMRTHVLLQNAVARAGYVEIVEIRA
jgi:hypothetical protein